MNLSFQMTSKAAPKALCKPTLAMRQSLDILAMGSRRLRSYMASQSADNPFLRFEDVSAYPAKAESLNDCLRRQIRMAFPLEADRRIADELAAMVDDAGYLALDAGDIAGKMGWDRHQVERIITAMRCFEPTGICASDLADCLRLQLEEQGKLDAVMETILRHLPLAGEKRWACLARLADCDESQVQERMRVVRCLDPKPGAQFNTTSIIPRFADVTLRCQDDGQWWLNVHRDAVPRIRVDRGDGACDHSDETTNDPQGDSPDDSKVRRREKMRQADHLVRSVERRAHTLLHIVHGIMTVQSSFFQHGSKALRPLDMRYVARMTSCHPSTVCRAVQDKYMATPKGFFPLKFFLDSPAYPNAVHTSGYVRDVLRHMIEAEAKPLSDQVIAERLDRMGFPLRRRTVARYRRMMDIPSSHGRFFDTKRDASYFTVHHGEDSMGSIKENIGSC